MGGDADMSPWTLKRCRRCGEHKLLEEFWHDARDPSGYQRWCKECLQTPRLVSLQTPIDDKHTLMDVLVAEEPDDDPTYAKAVVMLWENIFEQVITVRQAGAILYHAVDLVPFEAIGERVGISGVRVHQIYHAGIERLRRRYA